MQLSVALNIERIKSVSEDIGYSRASIYKWRKQYLKKGTLGLMNRKNIPSGELKEGCRPSDPTTESSPEVAELKAQMLEMQMEFEISKCDEELGNELGCTESYVQIFKRGENLDLYDKCYRKPESYLQEPKSSENHIS